MNLAFTVALALTILGFLTFSKTNRALPLALLVPVGVVGLLGMGVLFAEAATAGNADVRIHIFIRIIIFSTVFVLPALWLPGPDFSRSYRLALTVYTAYLALFILAPGFEPRVSELIDELVSVSRSGQSASLNRFLFREAAESWNSFWGVDLVAHPGTVKNSIAESASLMLYLGMAARPRNQGQQLFSVSGLILTLFIFITQSRSAIIALSLMILSYLAISLLIKNRALWKVKVGRNWFRRGLLFLVIILVAAGSRIIVTRFSDADTSSAENRSELLEYYVGEFSKDPIIGTASVHESGLPAHLIPLDWVFLFGIFGLIGSLILLTLAGLNYYKSLSTYVRTRRIAVFGVAGIFLFSIVRALTTGSSAWSPQIYAGFACALILSNNFKNRPAATADSTDHITPLVAISAD